MASFFYGFQYILRLLPNVIRADLINLYGIDAAAFGTFNAVYYLGYALFHIPAGVLIDRIGVKSVMTLSILGCGLGISAPLISPSWELALLGRFILGAASSPAILGLFKIIQSHFPATRFSSVLGVSVTIGLSGGLFGNRPVGILKELIGWEYVTWVFIITSLLLSALFVILMPKANHTVSVASQSTFKSLRQLLSNKHVWAVALLSGLMIGPLEGFADAWGVPFFETVYHLDTATAQTLPSVIFFGFCFGAPLLGYLGEKIQRPYTIMILCALVMAITYVFILSATFQNTLWLYGAMILIGLLCAFQVFMIFINTRVVASHLVSISSSFTNMVMMSFGTIFHAAIGSSITYCWDGTTLNEHPIYSTTAYTIGLSIIPLGLLIAGLGFLWIKPKNESKLFDN